jgi:hypothetical protein
MMSRLVLGLFLAAVAAGAPAQQLMVQQQDGMRFVTGGVGLEEREALKSMSGDFNVRLTFAVKGTGAYVANVDVAIADAKGMRVLTANADGPKLYAQLAPGKYTVKATFSGKTQTRRISVGKMGATEATFLWSDPSSREHWGTKRSG